MKPYYEEGGITIYHGDCRDVLPSLSGVGQVLTSPPYNLTGARGTKWSQLREGYGEHADDMPHDEYVEWQRSVLRLCWETLTNDGAIYYNHKPRVLNRGVLLPFELNPDLPLRQIVTWDRMGGFVRTFAAFIPQSVVRYPFAQPPDVKCVAVFAREGE